MASITQRFLVPVSTVSARNAWHNDLPFVSQKFRGVLPEKLEGGVQHASWNPYPISDQNLWFSLPYFRPDQKFDTWRPGALRVTGARDKLLRHVHGSWRKHWKGMVLLPNDEDVANSSKKRALFKTRVHKPYPISDKKRFRPKQLKKRYPLGQHIPIYPI